MRPHSNFTDQLRRHAIIAGASALMGPIGLGAWTAPAHAQPISDRPIRIVVTAPPGGSADMLARLIAEGMTKGLGQPVIVDNKPGGMGAIAMDSFLMAPRDGHTLLFSLTAVFSEAPHTLKPKYDPLKDVKPLVEAATSPLVLVGNPNLPPKNMAELVAYVKANPGKINFASYSPGTLSHVMGLQLNKAAGLDMQHIGYKGTAPALQDVMGGQVQFMFDGLGTSVQHIKAGKLRAFAVSSPERSPVLPDVPTLAELGYKDLTRVVWLALLTTPDVPAPVQQRMRDEAIKALSVPAVRERLAGLGLTFNAAKPPTPEQMSRTIAADYQSVGDVLKSVNYKPE